VTGSPRRGRRSRWSLGEAVKAIVVIAPGAPTTIAEFDAHCLTHMAPYKRPRWYELADAIPRTHRNKIIKRDLRSAHDPGTRFV
jgi:fatty-acyl-CoA synthase